MRDMVRVRRATNVVHHRTVEGTSVRLRSRVWSLTIAGRRWRIAMGYLGPTTVETDSASARIRDHLGILRLLLVAIWIGGLIRRLGQ